MRVEAIKYEQLTDAHRQRWNAFQAANPALSSPFFRSEFVQALGDVGRPIEVGIFEDQGEIVGFLPFERRRFQMGRPVGFPMNDYQGIICPPGRPPDLMAVTSALRLRGFDFDHLVAEQGDAISPGWERAESLIMEFPSGFDEYIRESQTRSFGLFRDNARKTRRAERELGEVQFEFHTNEEEIFRSLLEWKSQQYVQNGLVDLFAAGWPAALLERLRKEQHPEFRCVVSALTIGDRLAAVHLSLRCRETLHSWFPAYDPEFARYSPGMILLLEMARLGIEDGITRIDLGKGTENYKRKLGNASIPLAEGSIINSSMIRAFRNGWRQTRQWMRETGARRWLETPIGWARHARKALELR